MTFSHLISGTLPHHGKYSSREGAAIMRCIPHHWAGTAGGDARLTDPSVQASANYIIYSDGRIFGQVPEEYRPWTSGSQAADAPSITFEIQNSGGRPPGVSDDSDPRAWPISDEAFASVVALVVDIARRYGWKTVDGPRVRGHREFAQTACPGGYVWHKLQAIRSAADAALNGQQPDGLEEDDDMRNTKKAMFYMDGTSYNVVIGDTASGWAYEYTTVDPAVNNQMAALFETGDFGKSDRSMVAAFSQSLAAVRSGRAG